MKHKKVIQHIQFVWEIPAIIMELAKHGTLYDCLFHRTKPAGNCFEVEMTLKGWILRMKWAMQITNALVFLHSNGVLHSEYHK
jgi:hypothetical protein